MRKLYLLLTTLLAVSLGQTASAQETITVQIRNTTGTIGTDNGTSTWQKRWTSDASSGIEGFELLDSHNNINKNYSDTEGLAIAPGSALTGTITLTAPSGYSIDSYSYTINNTYSGASTKTITVGETSYTVEGDASLEISITDIGESSTTFTFAGDNTVAYFEDFDVVISELSQLEKTAQIYAEYADYLSDLQSNSSSDQTPGTYDASLVEAFSDALEAALVIDDPDAEDMSDEELEALANNIISTYEAAVASKQSYAMSVAEGYYFLQTYPMFYETVTELDEDTGEEINETVYLSKGMYSELSGTSIYAKWMTPDGTAPFLWKVTAVGDKTYQLVNMGTDAQISAISTSANVAMSTEIDTTMMFDYSNTTDDIIYYNIRLSGAAERGGNGQYAHCGGHSSGAGTSGNIVGWNNTYSESSGPGASGWKLVAVSDEEAAAIIEAYAPYKDDAARYANAVAILEDVEPKMEIAADEEVAIVGDGLITDVSQLSSPYTESSEGSLDALLDGDLSTYWHSAWSGGSLDGGIHYLQVELNDITDLDYVVFTISRRAVSNDHVTSISVYGASDSSEDISKDECELLATISLPYGSNTETLTSTLIALNGYTYLRFYAEETTSSRGYWHCSEFQLYKAVDNTSETTQAKMMGEIYTDLETAVAAAEAEGEDITLETYTALKNAYDAFIAVYVDPTDLRTAISEASTATEGIVIGTNPGEWSDDSATSALTSVVSAASAYDAAGVYTTEQSESYIEQIEAAETAITDAANQVQEGKWYNFRFASEELYTANGWDTSGADATSTYPSLYDKLVVVGDVLDGDDYGIVPSDVDEVAMGHGLYLIDEIDLDGAEDMAQFRFISVGDTAYMIQNRATGLFLRAAGTSGAVTLSIHPSLWTNSAMGYGKNITTGTSITGNNENHLHTQLSGNSLVTWSSSNVESNTGFLIETVEDVAEDYSGTDFYMSLVPGTYYAMTYPVSVTGVDGSLYGVVVEDTTITLQVYADNTAAAGQPFIYIADTDAEVYDASAAEEFVAFTHGMELNATAGEAGVLIGSYDGDTAPAGSVIASGNGLAIVSADTDIDSNSAYINAEIANTDSGLDVNVTTDIWNAIKTAVVNATKTGDIYSIDGTKVGTGNLSTVKGLKKGLYIVNGTKVLVK